MFIVSAARYNNINTFTGRTDLGKSKPYKTLAAANQHGVSSLVKSRDGNNFVVILGPEGQCQHKIV